MTDPVAGEVLYQDEPPNRRMSPVRLTMTELAGDYRFREPLTSLNLVATAEAYLRGRWLGGGGSERRLERITAGRQMVPVIRASGSAWPVNVERAAEFARVFGELAVRKSGGPEQVAAALRKAQAEDVPLWMARRRAAGRGDLTVMVAVDRRLVRADVWAPNAPRTPVVRLRGPDNLTLRQLTLADLPLTVTVGGERAELVIGGWSWRSPRLRSVVRLRAPQGTWELSQLGWLEAYETVGTRRRSSRMSRDGRAVALLTRPKERDRRRARILPLAEVAHPPTDPLDAAMAHFLGVAFGLGDAAGSIRFGVTRPLPTPEQHIVWEQPWYTGVGSHWLDEGEGGDDDGWGGDGADNLGNTVI